MRVRLTVEDGAGGVEAGSHGQAQLVAANQHAAAAQLPQVLREARGYGTARTHDDGAAPRVGRAPATEMSRHSCVCKQACLWREHALLRPRHRGGAPARATMCGRPQRQRAHLHDLEVVVGLDGVANNRVQALQSVGIRLVVLPAAWTWSAKIDTCIHWCAAAGVGECPVMRKIVPRKVAGCEAARRIAALRSTAVAGGFCCMVHTHRPAACRVPQAGSTAVQERGPTGSSPWSRDRRARRRPGPGCRRCAGRRSTCTRRFPGRCPRPAQTAGMRRCCLSEAATCLKQGVWRSWPPGRAGGAGTVFGGFDVKLTSDWPALACSGACGGTCAAPTWPGSFTYCGAMVVFSGAATAATRTARARRA